MRADGNKEVAHAISERGKEIRKKLRILRQESRQIFGLKWEGIVY